MSRTLFTGAALVVLAAACGAGGGSPRPDGRGDTGAHAYAEGDTQPNIQPNAPGGEGASRGRCEPRVRRGLPPGRRSR